MKQKAYQYCSNLKCSNLTKTGGLCEKCQARKVETDLLFVAKGSVEDRKCNTVGCDNAYRGKRMDFSGVCDICKLKNATEKHTSWLMGHSEVPKVSSEEKSHVPKDKAYRQSKSAEQSKKENTAKNIETNSIEDTGSIMQTINSQKTSGEQITEEKTETPTTNISEDITVKTSSELENKSTSEGKEKIPSGDLISSLMLLHGESSQTPNLLDSSIKHLYGLMKSVSVSKKKIPENMGEVVALIEAHNANAHNVQTAVNCAKTLKEFMKLRLEVAEFVHKSNKGD